MEFRGGTAFTVYGCFRWFLIFIWIAPFGNTSADKTSMGFYLLLWCIFTFMMFIGTLKYNCVTQVVFLSLTVLFLLLSLGDFSRSETIIHIADWVGIFCGLSAMYSATGQVVNNEFGKAVIPLG